MNVFAISVQHAKESFSRFVLHVTDSERETNFRQKLRFDFSSNKNAKMPQSEISNNEQSADGMATVSDLNDQDVLIQYCLTNKVNKIAIDELLKRGFDSLEALKLVTMEDMSSVNIPMGQRRLIFHIAQALNPADSTSGSSGSKTMTTTSVEGNTGIPLTASGVSTGNISIPTTVAGGSAGASPSIKPAFSCSGTVTTAALVTGHLQSNSFEHFIDSTGTNSECRTI